MITETKQLSSEMNKNVVVKKIITQLRDGDTVIVDGLALLGNSLYTSLKNMVAINNKRARISLFSEKLDFEVDAMLFDILNEFLKFEKWSMQERAKKAKQTREKKATKVGRKKGGKVKSIFDSHRAKIIKFNTLGLSKSKIVAHIGVGTPQALGNYIKKLNLAQEQKKSKKSIKLETDPIIGIPLMKP